MELKKPHNFGLALPLLGLLYQQNTRTKCKRESIVYQDYMNDVENVRNSKTSLETISDNILLILKLCFPEISDTKSKTHQKNTLMYVTFNILV